jgi:hypothetical protein
MTFKDEIIEQLTKKNEALSAELKRELHERDLVAAAVSRNYDELRAIIKEKSDDLDKQTKISLMWENDRDHWKGFTKSMINVYHKSFEDASNSFEAIKKAFKEEPFADALEEIDTQAELFNDTFKCTSQFDISEKARYGPASFVSKWDPSDHNECYCGKTCWSSCKKGCKCFNFCKGHAFYGQF